MRYVILFLTLILASCSEYQDSIPSAPVDSVTGQTIEREVITLKEARLALNEAFGRGGYRFFTDHFYLRYSVEEVMRFLLENDVDEMLWVEDFFDCDDFARVVIGDLKREFPGIPVFYLKYYRERGWHAVVGLYDPEHEPEIVLFEPQTDMPFVWQSGYYVGMIFMRRKQ